MSAEKLSSKEIPLKFTEWLINMGCPQEKIPSLDKMTQICRGQYYMVWRSLMERVQSKKVIHQKKMQVFCDDIKICKQENAIGKVDSNVVIPEQLLMWKKQLDLKQKVADAEARVVETRQNLEDILNKTSKKLIQRKQCRRRIEDVQRRIWLLRQVASDLETKKNNLEETKKLASSFNSVDCDDDIQVCLNKCIEVLQRQSPPSHLQNPLASSSVLVSHDQDAEESIESLTKCRGDVVWPQLVSRRAALVADLAAAYTESASSVARKQATPQSVVAQTAALVNTLLLEVMKNDIHFKNTKDKIVASVEVLNNCLSNEECELLVVRCERACSEMRVKVLKSLVEELATGRGLFFTGRELSDDVGDVANKMAEIDNNIASTKDELKVLLTSLVVMERKMQNIRKCLHYVFNMFHKEQTEDLRCTGNEIDLPPESALSTRRYFAEKQEKAKNKTNLSLDLDISEGSFNDTTDKTNVKFVDELKIFMKKFNLEKNRKLVLDSGEIIWCFQTLQESVTRLHSNWLSNDVTPLLRPSVSLSRNLQCLRDEVRDRDNMSEIAIQVRERNNTSFVLDITTEREEEEKLLDKTKKCIGDNLTKLQKITKVLDLSQYNLEFWSSDQLKKYISSNRTVDGRSYKYYEALYLESIARA